MRHATSLHGLQVATWAAVVAGFLPWNFPRARIFMGDVGSGSIGLLVAIAAIWQVLSPASAALSWLVAASAFVLDATCTLLSRMLYGRRWYAAHREHLYQWLVRCGFSHARVASAYMAWNLLLVVPVLYLMNLRPSGAPPAPGYAWAGGVYGFGLLVWLVAKRWCLHRVKCAARHVPA